MAGLVGRVAGTGSSRAITRQSSNKVSDVFTTIINFGESLLGRTATSIGMGFAVWKFFDTLDGLVQDAQKVKIARWLKVKNFESNLAFEQIETWPTTFAGIFDRVFGNRHLSVKCFLRSSLVSLVLSIVAWLSVFGEFHSIMPGGRRWKVVLISRFIWPYVLFVNVIPDYLSLLVSRGILTLMQQSRVVWVWVCYLILDTILTFYLAALAVVIVMQIRSPSPDSAYSLRFLLHPSLIFQILFDDFLISVNVEDLTNGSSAADGIMISHFWFYLLPACFTSLWLWLYVLSGAIVKAFQGFNAVTDRFNSWMKVDTKPLSAMGFVGGVFSAVLYFVLHLDIWSLSPK
jgi:hypothetical protein